jgi:hypothetical protein
VKHAGASAAVAEGHKPAACHCASHFQPRARRASRHASKRTRMLPAFWLCWHPAGGRTGERTTKPAPVLSCATYGLVSIRDRRRSACGYHPFCGCLVEVGHGLIPNRRRELCGHSALRLITVALGTPRAVQCPSAWGRCPASRRPSPNNDCFPRCSGLGRHHAARARYGSHP